MRRSDEDAELVSDWKFAAMVVDRYAMPEICGINIILKFYFSQSDNLHTLAERYQVYTNTQTHSWVYDDRGTDGPFAILLNSHFNGDISDIITRSTCKTQHLTPRTHNTNIHSSRFRLWSCHIQCYIFILYTPNTFAKNGHKRCRKLDETDKYIKSSPLQIDFSAASKTHKTAI